MCNDDTVRSSSAVGNVIVQTRYKRDPRQLDEDEESWFDEEEEEFIPSSITAPTTTATPLSITDIATPSTVTKPLSAATTPTPSYFVTMLTSSESTVSSTTTPLASSAYALSPRPGVKPETVGSRLQLLENIRLEMNSAPTLTRVSPVGGAFWFPGDHH